MQSLKLESRRLDWPTVILIIFLSQVASGRVAITKWTEFLYFAQTMAIMGVILGLALGYSQFKGKTALLLALGYSIVIIPWQMTQAIDEEVVLSERLVSVGGRLLFSLGQFFQRETVEDGLLFVTFISMLLWILWIVSGFWWARHNNYLAAILPGGIFTLTIHLYDTFVGSRIWIMGFYFMFALMLLGRLYYLKNHEAWRKRGVFQVQESSFDLTQGVLIAATAFIILAWSVPASQAGWESAIRTWYRLTKPVREMQEWFSNAVESLESPGRRTVGDFYTNQLGLGDGNPLSDTVVFSVEVPDFVTQAQPRLYWRGFTYNLYENNRWSSISSSVDEYFPSEDQLGIPDAGQRMIARFVFKTQIRLSLLYTASQPLWISRPGHIKTTLVDTDKHDLAAWFADPRLSPGEQYQVQASLANPSIQDLQAAGTEYPEWVTERYLQLPEDFSPEIRDLAVEVTEGLETPYDKAEAITTYLRREIVYANPLPESVPDDKNPLEWVLFDLKQGFCNYYASAEVLMLRSLGIPARMAVGFAEGDFDDEAHVYNVRSLDAHAWPEVYFPEIGWVEFEPTGNQAPLVRPDRPETDLESTPIGPNADFLRPEEKDEQPPDDLLSDVEEIDINTGTRPLTSYPLFYISIAIVLAGVFLFLNHRYKLIDSIPVRIQTSYGKNGGETPAWINNWAKWTMLTPIERSFETINRSLRLLDENPPVYATPVERARVLSEMLPQAKDAIETLSEQHQTSLFTPQSGDAGIARRASLSIWLYTMQVIIQTFIKNLERRFSRPGQFQ